MDSEIKTSRPPPKSSNHETISRALNYEAHSNQKMSKSPTKELGNKRKEEILVPESRSLFEPHPVLTSAPTNEQSSFLNKFPSQSPGKSKQDFDPISNNRMLIASPFTKFCQDLNFGEESLSPMLTKQASFGPSYDYSSPTPIKYQMYDNTNSPNPFQRKSIRKLDFSISKVVVKSTNHEVSIEQEEPYEEPKAVVPDSFTHALSCNEDIQAPAFSPKFREKRTSFSLATPTHTARTSYTEKECRFSKYDDRDEDGYITPKGPMKQDSKVLSESPKNRSSKKFTLDSMNSFSSRSGNLENLMIRREMSFGPPNISSNQHSGKKMYDEDDDEDPNVKSRKKIFCNCKKSKCLKLYCDCFARGEYCSKDCNCTGCANNDSNLEERESAMASTLDRNPNAFRPKVDKTESPVKDIAIQKAEAEKHRVRHMKGCNCKKSGCLKKYCECFQASVKCTEICKCENCKNMDPAAMMKRAQNFGYMNFNSNEIGFEGKPENSDSQFSFTQSNKRKGETRERELEREDDDEFDDEELKKLANPRKQTTQIGTFNSFQSTSLLNDIFKGKKREGPMTPKHMIKREEGDSQLGSKEKKGSTFKTPLNTKIEFEEYTPSPNKPSLSEGRSRRNVKQFTTRFNPDEYDMSSKQNNNVRIPG